MLSRFGFLHWSPIAELAVSSLDGVVLILQEGFTFPHVISAVERSEQVWWVSLARLFSPILSELKVICALWKRCGKLLC